MRWMGEHWIEMQEMLDQGICVFWNGMPISDRCLAFEKLYSEKTAYWGSAQIVLRLDPGKAEGALVVPVTALVYGIIQWIYAKNVNPGDGGIQ